MGLCLLILKLLQKRHNHVFVLVICEFYNRGKFCHLLVTPRVFIARGKIFRKKVRGLEIVIHIM